MEALLEREEEQVESWNDDRLDELSGRMDDGFREMREGFARIDQKLDQLPTREEIDQRFAAVTREMDVRFATADRHMNQRFEATDRRIDRLNLRLEHMVWAMVAAAGGIIGNFLSDKI
jgi:macrodomain Ter protein organizer (MatP/YcbG family)